MAANLRAVAEHGPALVFSSNLHLQRNKSVMPFGDQQLEWWSVGAISATHLATGTRSWPQPSARSATTPRLRTPSRASCPRSRGNHSHRRPPPGQGHYEARPAHLPRFRYFPLDPAQLDMIDGIVFLKQVVRLD
jgi:hypothetical protein